MEVSTDIIKDIAIKAVEGFVNNEIPLSTSIANSAKDLKLNPEQIKRVIEATNSLAYLKLLENSPDRTFEFPVAEYEEVMRDIVISTPTTESDCKSESHEKEASEPELEMDLSMQEKYAALCNEYLTNKYQLEKLAFDIEELGLNLEKAINIVKNDPYGLEKLAFVADESVYSKVSNTLYGIVKEASSGSVFTDKELKEAFNLVDLFKQAHILFEEKSNRQQLHEKLAGAMSRLAGKAVGGVGKGIGKSIGTAIGAPIGLGVGAAGKILSTAPVKNTAKAAALPLLAGAGMKPMSGPDVWDALH